MLQVPLLLWVAAVMTIYGTSYSNLQGLQAPLASLVRTIILHYMAEIPAKNAHKHAYGTILADAADGIYRHAMCKAATSGDHLNL
jgi:hypothetical protein